MKSISGAACLDIGTVMPWVLKFRKRNGHFVLSLSPDLYFLEFISI